VTAPYATHGITYGFGASDSSTSTNPLSFLTANDRDLIAKATGVIIGSDGRNQDGNGTAPILALEIAYDRQTGRLPAGQPITSTYLTSRCNTAAGDPSFVASVNRHPRSPSSAGRSRSAWPQRACPPACGGSLYGYATAQAGGSCP
jgi:hypothetical protein